MSFSQAILLHMPAWLLCILMMVIYMALAVFGLVIARKYYPHHKCKLHNDIAGYIFSTLSAIYAVLLAFTVVITWQDFDKAHDITVYEANSIASLYKHADQFPNDLQANIKNELVVYVKTIINEEWPMMAVGKGSDNVQKIQENLWKYYHGFQPKDETQKIFLAESVQKLNRASEMRIQRIDDAGQGLHAIFYFVLIIGSFITIGFTMLLSTENIIPQLIMTSMLATMIAISLFTIMALDYPFTGDINIQPDALNKVFLSWPGKK